jgi:hypothetical protein
MEKTIEEKVLTVLAQRGQAHRNNITLAKEFLATMKERGLNPGQVVSLVQFVSEGS